MTTVERNQNNELIEGENLINNTEEEEEGRTTSKQVYIDSFKNRAEDMGLTPPRYISGEIINNECFYYEDIYSAIGYKYLYTADNEKIPAVSIHAGPELDKLEYCGVLSSLYRFVGNEYLVSSIEESLREAGTPVFSRRHRLTSNYCKFNYSVVIDNQNNFSGLGDIRPMMDVYNSYDGSSAAVTVFGIQIRDGNGVYECGLSKKFGKFREVHIRSSRTSLSPIIGTFSQNFANGIDDLVQMNNNPLDEDMITDTLRFIEKLGGKKRKANISAILEDINSDRQRITNWDIFKAITYYTTQEENLNLKRLDNLVERVLHVPTNMYRLVR